jgi:hypothetical protein
MTAYQKLQYASKIFPDASGFDGIGGDHLGSVKYMSG